MALNITHGKIAKAQKVVVYGTEGIGKTTFAAQFPNPLFIDTEGSTEHYDVARTEAPQSWSMQLAQVQEVKVTRPCGTLVIDTADWAEKLCIEHICAKYKWDGIEAPGYGKGYTYLAEEFGKLLNLLSDVAAAGVNVVVTAHAAMRKFEQPDEAAGYDRWELKLQKKIAPMLKEWADAVLFVNYKTIVETVGTGMGQAKGKARGNKRVMYCQHHACWDAKNRWGLPEEIPFDYAQIAQFVPAQLTPASASAPMSTPQPIPYTQQASLNTQKPVLSTSTAQQKPVQSLVYAQDGTLVSDNKQPTASPQLPGYWEPVLQLMKASHVALDEIKAMSVAKGFFTAETPIENYPKEYVEGGILAQWDKCLQNIKDLRKQEPVPFN